MTIQLPDNVKWIIDSLMYHGYDAYAVGGCIRDSLLGRCPDDWDITTSARPEQVKEIFKRTVDTGLAHGTVTVLADKETYEVTTYRIDGEYEDNRHPKKVTFTAELLEDLKRRDFTINAMAYNEVEGLVDAFCGKEDLEKGLIRCVGNPSERFKEDALRVLRAVRFAAQLGFAMEEKTKHAVKELAGQLNNISAERIRSELVKLLCSPHPEVLKMAHQLGITSVILPEFDRMMVTAQHNPHHCFNVGDHTLAAVCAIHSDKILRLTMLLHDVGKPDTESVDEEGISHFINHAKIGEKIAVKIIRRLKFDNETLNTVRRLVRWHDYRFVVNEKNIRHAIYKIGADIFDKLILVMRADVSAQSTYLQKEKLAQLDEIELIYKTILQKDQCISLQQLAVNGKDIMDLGIPAGRKIGLILQQLLEYVLDDPEKNEKNTLLDKARSIIEADTFSQQ